MSLVSPISFSKRFCREELPARRAAAWRWLGTGVEETGVTFERPKRFNARKYLEKAFKVFASQEAVPVVLHFAPSAAKRVTERRWHSTQRFETLSNGTLEMALRVGLAPDLYSWIGGFFGECRVVEPGELREEMIKRFEEALSAQIG